MLVSLLLLGMTSPPPRLLLLRTGDSRQVLVGAFLAGALVGVLGGMIGLGEAEFRLPLLISVFGFAALQAIIMNKAISLIVVITALPACLISVPLAELAPYGYIVINLLAGSLLGAWIGANWATKLRSKTLFRLIAGSLSLGGVVADNARRVRALSPRQQLHSPWPEPRLPDRDDPRLHRRDHHWWAATRGGVLGSPDPLTGVAVAVVILESLVPRISPRPRYSCPRGVSMMTVTSSTSAVAPAVRNVRITSVVPRSSRSPFLGRVRFQAFSSRNTNFFALGTRW